MTLTVWPRFQTIEPGFGGRCINDQRIASEEVYLQGVEESGDVRPSYNAKGCEVLLEEPAIGLWAAETGMTYGVSAVDALELLAYALFLDGEM